MKYFLVGKIMPGSESLSVTSSKVLLAMKITLFALLALVTAVHAEGKAQAVTLSFSQVSIEQVFEEITKQTNYRFLYSDEVVKAADLVTLNIRDADLQDVLKTVLGGQGLVYKVIAETVIVSLPRPTKKVTMNLKAEDDATVQQEEILISGKVMDATQAPLAEATVVVKGQSNIAAKTNEQGHFSLRVPRGAQVMITFLGFTQYEFTASGEGPFQIVMAENAAELHEVVVTALGIERDKKALGYATQSVGGDQLAEARQSNVINNLSGRVAGVQITGNSMPGSGAHVVIRGSGSVAGNNQPLIVLDGVPIDQATSRTHGGGLSEINPDNIKEMTVLKGPTAAALYGSRAANGVIMVTTKDGKGMKGIGVEFNTNHTFERPFIEPEFQNTYGGGTGYRTWYVDGRNGYDADGIRGTAGVDESWGQPMDGSLVPLWYSAPERVPLLPQPDNWDDFWETGRTGSYNVALSGSNDLGNFRLSVGRLDQQSIMYYNDYYRNNFKLNAGYNFTPKFHASVSAEYVRSGSDNRGYTGGSEFIWSHRHTDFTKLKNWEEYYDIQKLTFREGDFYPYANWQHEYFSNPYYSQKYLPNSNVKDRLVGNIALTYDFTDHLNLMVRSGTDYGMDNRTNIGGMERMKNNVTIKGSYDESAIIRQETNNDAILTFNKPISERFSLNIQAGAANRVNFYKQMGVDVNELTVDKLYNLENYASPVTPTNTLTKSEVNSLFGSAQVGFDNALFLDITARNDWSSTLPTDGNSFFYPSIALSAVLTDLFDIRSNVLSFAKIRASAAAVGSDGDPYMLQQVFLSQGLWAGSVPMYAASSEIANNGLKPESTAGQEYGLEMRLFNGKLSLDATYYSQVTTNQIFSVAISKSSGYDAQILNAGRVTNKGIEIMLSGTPIKTPSGFSWDLSFNFARNRNLVEELAEGLTNYTLGSQNGLTSEARVGEPYGTLYGRRYLRAPNGQIVYSNGLPQLEEGTFALGNIQPDWMGGFSNTFRYKSFSLSALVDVKMGGDIFDVGSGLARKTGQYIETVGGREEGVIGVGVKNVGTAAAPEYVTNDVIVDAMTFWNAQNPRTYHESGVFDASYVRLREATLSYSFPKGFLGNNFFQSLRLSVVGRNLLMFFRNHPHIDPEVDMKGGNAQGFASGQQPTTRNIGFNLNLTF